MLHLLNLVIIGSYLFFYVFFREMDFLLLEDHVVEYSGAILAFIGSCFLAVRVWKHRHQLSKLYKFLLVGFALFLFVAAGEEVSWCQRIFDVETPETVAKHNMQGELNLHNLEIFNRRDSDGDKTGLALLTSAEFLYNIIALGMFFVLPMLRPFSGKLKPLIPTWHFMLPVFLTFAMMKLGLYIYGDIQGVHMTLQRGLGELKESLLSGLFAVHALVNLRFSALSESEERDIPLGRWQNKLST